MIMIIIIRRIYLEVLDRAVVDLLHQEGNAPLLLCGHNRLIMITRLIPGGYYIISLFADIIRLTLIIRLFDQEGDAPLLLCGQGAWCLCIYIYIYVFIYIYIYA